MIILTRKLLTPQEWSTIAVPSTATWHHRKSSLYFRYSPGRSTRHPSALSIQQSVTTARRRLCPASIVSQVSGVPAIKHGAIHTRQRCLSKCLAVHVAWSRARDAIGWRRPGTRAGRDGGQRWLGRHSPARERRKSRSRCRWRVRKRGSPLAPTTMHKPSGRPACTALVPRAHHEPPLKPSRRTPAPPRRPGARARAPR